MYCYRKWMYNIYLFKNCVLCFQAFQTNDLRIPPESGFQTQNNQIFPTYKKHEIYTNKPQNKRNSEFPISPSKPY